MPGKGINGRANMQKFQMNSKKYGGNPFKYASLVSSVGRASKGGMWNSIQSRAITHPPIAPAAPTNLIVTDIAAGVVKIVWTAPTNIGSSPITDYEYDLDNGGWITVTPAGLEQTLTGLTVGVTYSFKVRAVSIIGDGAEATTTITQLIPDAPTSLSQLVTSVTGTVGATPTDASVKLAWTAPANAPITDYLFSTDDANYTSNGSVNTEVTVDFLASNIPVPAAGTTLTFYIKAKNNVGISPSVSVTLAGFTPGPITNNTNFLAAIDGYLGTPVQKEAVLKAYYNIEDWNVTQVTDMRDAFVNGRQTSLGGNLNSSTFNEDIGNWNTSSVTDMSFMFYGAAVFNQDIGNWNTAAVIDMRYMFNGAIAFNQNITTNGNNWNTAAVIDMSSMFANAAAFNQNISNWDTSSVIDMSGMFYGAAAFNQNINGWDTAAVTNMSSMFKDTTLTNATISGWDTAAVTDMSNMFNGANLTNADISALVGAVAVAVDLSNMFNGADLTNADISGWVTTTVTNMSSMFNGADLTDVDPTSLVSLNTAAVTDMSSMFNGVATFNQDISGWNTAAVTDMSSMFNGATIFNQNISTWNTALVTNMSGMFNGAAAFNEDISGWDTAAVTDMSSMFNGAAAFNNKGNDLNWDRNTGSVTDMSSMFEDATAFNASVFFWDTTSVINMSSMFKGATAFNKVISVGSNTGNPPQYNYWQTDNVTDMSSMFEGATTFNVGPFPSAQLDINTAAVTDMSNMFNGATVFNRNLEHWDISSITTSANLKNCFNGSAVNQTFSDTTGGGTWFTTAQNLAAVADIPNFYTNGDDYDGNPATATQEPELTA